MDNLICRSILDNDLYKFTMQQAVLNKYPNIPVSYVFSNRRPEAAFNQKFLDALKDQINGMQSLSVCKQEMDWFKRANPFFDPSYYSYLQNYHFNSEQVNCSLKDGELVLGIEGPWEESILWEVPLLYTISELYFKYCDTDWTYDPKQQISQAIKKADILQNCNYADFGSRRRRSYQVHDLIVGVLSDKPGFVGTSNVLMAMKYDTKPIGTMAHEWIMGVSVLEGLRHANKAALNAWSDVFHGDLGIALTDTFGTDAFFEDFDGYMARVFDGVRHDSADPFVFGDKTIAHYTKKGIDPMTRTIVFSDGLNALLARRIQRYFQDKIRCSFGIGTHFTNDFPDSNPLNIVIKLWTCNGVPVVKLGDGEGKAIGDIDAQRVARWTFHNTPLDEV